MRPYVGMRRRLPLILASGLGQLEEVQRQISLCPDLDVRGEYGWTALMHAADKGRHEIARALLDAGADVNAKGEHGETALTIALRRNNVMLASLLIESHADVSAEFDNWTEWGGFPEWDDWNFSTRSKATPLSLAFGLENSEMAQLLISRGVPVTNIEKHRAKLLEIEINRRNRMLDETIGSANEHTKGADIRGIYSIHLELIKREREHEENQSNQVPAPDSSTQSTVADLLHEALTGHTDVLIKMKEIFGNLSTSDLMCALMIAAAFGDKSAVSELLSAGADPNEQSHDGSTPLMLAAMNEHGNVAQMLLNAGSNTNLTDSERNTALMHAAMTGNLQVFDVLLRGGADPAETKSWRNGATLRSAVTGNHREIVRRLIQAGAEANRLSQFDLFWQSPLALAAQKGNLDIVEMLVGTGENVNLADFMDRTPLMHAAANGHATVVDFLQASGASARNSNGRGESALILAAQRGHVDVVKILLKNGANIEDEDGEGMTALMFAARENRIEVVRLLVDEGADITSSDGKRGRTALLWASYNGNTEIARFLMDVGANVSTEDMAGYDALAIAADRGHFGVARTLLAYGADVDSQNFFGWTATMLAAGEGNFAMSKLLIDAGANIMKKCLAGKTALIYSEHPRVTKLLISCGAEINSASEVGETPLMFAANKEHWEETKLLLDAGADANAITLKGHTPLMYAEHPKSAELLLDFGGVIDARDHKGKTPLMHAAAAANPRVVSVLLEREANASAIDNEGKNSLLHLLEGLVEHSRISDRYNVDKNSLEVVKLLASAKTNGNSADNSRATSESVLAKSYPGLEKKFPELWAYLQGTHDEAKSSTFREKEDAAHQRKKNNLGLPASTNDSNECADSTIDFELGLDSEFDWEDEASDFRGRSNESKSEHNGTPPILEAAKKATYPGESDNWEEVQRLIDAGEDVNVSDDQGNSPLLLAIEERNLSIIRSLLAAGAKITGKWSHPVVTAARSYKEIMEAVIEADPNALDSKDGYTALMLLLMENEVGAIRHIIKAGADVNFMTKNGTALMHAKSAWAVQVLLEAGAQVDTCTKDGRTALMAAAERENAEVVKVLLKAGADISLRDRDGNSPLLYAAEGGTVRIVEALLAAGADIESVNNEGNTPVILAAGRNTSLVLEYLIERGANLDVKNKKGTTPLMRAAYVNSLNTTNTLLSAYIDVNAMDDSGWSALMYAGDMLRSVLRSAGTSIELLRENRTPLMIAAEYHNEYVIRRLIDIGANPDAVNADGETALMIFASKNEKGMPPNTHLAQVLIDAGANIDWVSPKNGMTPLIRAVLAENWTLATFLLESGASKNIALRSGRFALRLAMVSRGGGFRDQLESLDLLPEFSLRERIYFMFRRP